jgi:hypothetical protein
MTTQFPLASKIDLPSDWIAEENPGGGVDLRVSIKGRQYITVLVSVLAFLALRKTAALARTLPNVNPKDSIVIWADITMFLILFALWIGFADEVWHLERNCVIHRVGIGKFCYSSRFQDAELSITLRYSTRFNVPYYRLYAVMNGKPQFLIERNEKDLRKLAGFISSQTGWPIR